VNGNTATSEPEALLAKASDERLDRAGMTASILCAVHCAAGAAIAAAVPAVRVIESEWVERLFVAVSLALATLALRRGVALHRDRRVYGALVVGAVVLVAGRVIEFSSERAELATSLVGASALVLAHVINIRALRRCCAECGRR
jgi:hypothetical protein